MRDFKFVCEKFSYGMAVIAGILIIADGFYIFFSAIMRYFFNLPSGAVVDITGYVLFYSTFLAAPWLLKTNKHIAVELLSSHLSGKKRHLLELLSNFIGIIVCVFLCINGALITFDQFSQGTKLIDSFGTPKYVFTMAIPFSALLLMYFFLEKIAVELRSLISKDHK